MTLFHHVLSRMALLAIALWSGGGLILLSYFAFRWEVRSRVVGANAIAHFAERLFASMEMRAAAPRPESSRSSPGPRRRAEISPHPLRSASAFKPNYASEAGLVSVVIPTYNRAHIIRRAIESALAQTYGHLEIVVADDGSTDDTRAIAEGLGQRVVYVRQANAGVSAARNFGMKHARGEFIAFLDSDDSWQPWKIEAQVAALRRHPESGLVWTDMAAVDDGDHLVDARHLRVMYAAYGEVDIETTLSEVDTLGALSARVPGELTSAPVREGDLFGGILLGNLIHTSTVLFRRAWCEQTGGFDESFVRTGEDYEFYIRLCSAGPVVFIDAPSTLYRIGAADQLTAASMMLEIARNNLRAIKKWVPRSMPQIGLSRKIIRRRFAESFAWVGEEELCAGHRWTAARRLSESLALMPSLDRRLLLLAGCAVPDRALQRLRVLRHAMVANSGERPVLPT
jgi:glycosyltransferase involved in cell wall biosynthesis